MFMKIEKKEDLKNIEILMQLATNHINVDCCKKQKKFISDLSFIAIKSYAMYIRDLISLLSDEEWEDISDELEAIIEGEIEDTFE